MIKKVLGILGFALILGACSNTPNSINMSVANGVCVQPSYYTGVTPPSAINNNPTTAPYCMSVTLQNNNNGTNATNIQVTATGFTLAFTPTAASGATPLSSKLCDNTSSGGLCTSSGGAGNLGNVYLYDPLNCVTTQGVNVVTLTSGGGTCTFYLQLSGTSYAVGSYPMTLNYNYTNGNSNYTIAASALQNVSLYAGGNSGLYQAIYNSAATPAQYQWQPFSVTGAPTSGVTSTITDSFGNLYFTGNLNMVYQYNGTTVTPLGGVLPSSINSLAIDGNNNLYAGTIGNGIYTYSVGAASPAWTQLSSSIPTTANINNVNYTLSGTTSVLYATTSTQAYYCIAASPSLSYTCSKIEQSSGPTQFYQNANGVNSAGTFFVGSTNSAFSYVPTTPTVWSQYTFAPVITGNVYGVYPTLSSLYLGEVGAKNTAESSAYGCNIGSSGTSCAPLVSTSSNNVTGNVYDIAVDGANNVFTIGSDLNSLDFAPITTAAASGAYIGESGVTPTTVWNPITNGSGVTITAPLHTAVVTSSLVN